MSTLGKAVIEFSADTARFTGDIGRTAAMFDRNMARMESSIRSVRNALVAAVGLGGFGALVKGAIDAGDQLSKLSQKVGISVERLSELKLGAELADVDLNMLTVGLKEFNKSLLEAQDGNSKAAQVFKALGVDIKAGPDAALRQFAEAFSKLEEKVRAPIADMIMGKTGTQLVPFLAGGAEGMDKAARSARNLGLVMSDAFGKQAEQFNDNLKLLGKSTEALAIKFGGAAVEGLVNITNNIVKAAEKGEKWRGVMVELNKVLLATAALTPGWLGWLADKGATKAFADTEGSMFGPRRGLIRGPDGKPINQGPATPAPNADEVACAASGGKWTSGKCVRPGGSTSDPFGEQEKRLKLAQANAELADSEFIRMKVLLAEDKALKQLSPSQKERLLDLAAQTDVLKDLARQQKERDEGLAENAKEQTKLSNEDVERLTRNKAALIEQIDPIQKYRIELEKVRELLAKGYITPEQAAEAEFYWNNQIEGAMGLNKALDKNAGLWDRLGTMGGSALESLLFDLDRMTSALDFVKAMVMDVGREMARTFVTGPASKALSAALSQAFGASGGGGSQSDLMGATATGGPVSSNMMRRVGEHGPEVFMPQGAGTIIPNHELGGGVVINLHFEASTPAAVRDAVMACAPALTEAAARGVREKSRRGS